MKAIVSLLTAATLLSAPVLAGDPIQAEKEESRPPAIIAEGPRDISQYRFYSYPDISSEQTASLAEALEAEPTAAGPGQGQDESMEYYSYPAIGSQGSDAISEQPRMTPSSERELPGFSDD